MRQPPTSSSFSLKLKINSIILLWFLFFSLPVHAGAYEDILIAVQNDDNVAVIDLIHRGMDVNTTDRSGSSLLMTAARNGNQPLVTLLLANRANPKHQNQYGDSALALASLKGYVAIADLLLAAGADVNPEGWAPLHYAAFSGHTKLAALLLSHGAKIDARAPNGQTALMLAAKNGKLELVHLLLNARADMNLTDLNGKSAQRLAEQQRNSDIADYLRKMDAAN